MPPDYFRIRYVSSFAALVEAPLRDGVNALCWARSLPGDFGEVARALDRAERGIHALDEAELRDLPVSATARLAVEAMLADFRLLRDRRLDPVLNFINGDEHDEPEVRLLLLSSREEARDFLSDARLQLLAAAPKFIRAIRGIRGQLSPSHA